MAAGRKSRRTRKQSQVSQVSDLGEQLRQAVAAQLGPAKRKRRSRAKLTKLQRTQRKVFRSAVAFLKRKGIIPKIIDARKATPNSALRKIIRQNRELIERKETAYTLPPDFPKQVLRDLKKAGYKVRKGKLILPQGQYARGGKIFAKPIGKRPGGQIETIILRGNFEDQIRQAFSSLKDGEWIGFQVAGHNSYNIYHDANAMIRDLSGYAAEFLRSIGHITIFRTKHPHEYLRQRSAERQAKLEAFHKRRGERRKLKRAEKRRFEQGMKVTRKRA